MRALSLCPAYVSFSAPSSKKWQIAGEARPVDRLVIGNRAKHPHLHLGKGERLLSKIGGGRDGIRELGLRPEHPAASYLGQLVGPPCQLDLDILNQHLDRSPLPHLPRKILTPDWRGAGKQHRLDPPHPFAPAPAGATCPFAGLGSETGVLARSRKAGRSAARSALGPRPVRPAGHRTAARRGRSSGSTFPECAATASTPEPPHPRSGTARPPRPTLSPAASGRLLEAPLRGRQGPAEPSSRAGVPTPTACSSSSTPTPERYPTADRRPAPRGRRHRKRHAGRPRSPPAAHGFGRALVPPPASHPPHPRDQTRSARQSCPSRRRTRARHRARRPADRHPAPAPRQAASGARHRGYPPRFVAHQYVQ